MICLNIKIVLLNALLFSNISIECMAEYAEIEEGVVKIDFNFLHKEVECALTEEFDSIDILEGVQECYEKLISAISVNDEHLVREILVFYDDKFGEIFLMQVANKYDEITGYCPLLLAITIENPAIVKLLIDIGKVPLTVSGLGYKYALQFAESLKFVNVEAKFKICELLNESLKKPFRTLKLLSRLAELNKCEELYKEHSIMKDSQVAESAQKINKLNIRKMGVN